MHAASVDEYTWHGAHIIISIEDKVRGFDGSSPLRDRLAHPYHFVGFPGAIPNVGARDAWTHVFPIPNPGSNADC